MDDYYYNDDYWPEVPPFDDLTNHTKSKCCPEQQMLDQSGGAWTCVQYDEDVDGAIDIFRNISVNDLNNISFQIENFENDLNKICDSNDDILIWTPDSIDFSDNLARSDDCEEFFECLDVSRNILKDVLQPVVASCIPQDQTNLSCSEFEPGLVPRTEQTHMDSCYSGETERIFYLIFGLISVVAISIALVVYVLLPKQLLNIHGKVVVGNFISCLMFLVFLMITFSSCWTSWPLPGSLSCMLLGYFGYYSTMAMFAWMFALCLDMFCTFFGSGMSFTYFRLSMYCSLGWGVPAILLLMVIMFDHIVHTEVINPPDVGGQSCFLHEDSMNIFLNLPIFIFLSMNAILYISTVFCIYRTRSSIQKSVKKNNQMREDLTIFTKLFLVMGILWSFKLVSYHVDSHLFSLVFGILNLSRGSFMFIIFILKTSVLNPLKKLFESKQNNDSLMSEDSSCQRSKTSKTETSFCVTEF